MLVGLVSYVGGRSDTAVDSGPVTLAFGIRLAVVGTRDLLHWDHGLCRPVGPWWIMAGDRVPALNPGSTRDARVLRAIRQRRDQRNGEIPMAEKQDLLIYAAVYNSLDDALSDLEKIEQLHKDEAIGHYDAAVIDKENGKPHIAKRVDRPRIHVIPEWFGGGSLPRKELKKAAAELTSSDAGLIVVGEPTIEKAVTSALSKADKVVKQAVNASVDEIVSELQQALSGDS